MTSFVDLRGNVFGLLTVTSRGANMGRYAGWECRCGCGTVVTVRSDRLVLGLRKFCCLENHPKPNAGRDHPLTHSSWRHMHERCIGREDKHRRNYRDRGIAVCKRWGDFAAFLADMGERPGPEFSIERLDNDKGYEPGNCKWATDAEQRRNKRNTRRVEYCGRTLLLVDLCREIGLPYGVVFGRLKNGWSLDDALAKPVRPKRALAQC